METSIIIGTICGISIYPVKLIQNWVVSRSVTPIVAYCYGVGQVFLIFALVVLGYVLFFGALSLNIYVVIISGICSILLGIGVGWETNQLIHIKEIEDQQG